MSVAGQQDVEVAKVEGVLGAQEQGAGEQAAPGGWFDCAVNYAGPAETGVVYIHLRERNGQFDRWYQAFDIVKREMLATALTAMSTGLRVTAFVDTTDEYGTLNRLYVVRP
jgi:hypothetical protein